MSITTPHWMARTGVSLSLMATALLTLTQWRTWSGLKEAGDGLVLCVGAGVARGCCGPSSSPLYCFAAVFDPLPQLSEEPIGLEDVRAWIAVRPSKDATALPWM